MPDQFTQVTTKSYGSRIMDSLKGVVMGLLMFVVSFGVLYWNEGRVDVSQIAKTAVEVSATEQAAPEANGKLVSTSGTFSSTEKVGDTFLKEGSYISVQRNVEMYAWEEQSESTTQKNTGGSETTTTTYTYNKVWTSSPAKSAEFNQPTGHQNPAKTLNAATVNVKTAKFGMYDVDMNEVVLPEYKPLPLNANNVILSDNFKLANETYLYKGVTSVGNISLGNINNPEIGDLRISYSVIANPVEGATIFGQLDSAAKKISPFYGEKETKLYRVFQGTRDSAIITMHSEYTMLTWILRVVGFLLMWFGLMALFGPISVFLDVLPVFGSISRGGIGAITFIVSLVLSVITILISMILHNLIALIAVIVVVAGGIIFYLKMKRKK